MTANYRYIDHTADIAIEVSGNSYTELFIAALAGWKDSSIYSPAGERSIEIMEITFSEKSVEELLVSFLQELNYLFENKKLFPAELRDLHIEQKDDQFLLKSVIGFAPVSSSDEVKAEIKAVTFHQLDIKRVNNVYKTLIVFDI